MSQEEVRMHKQKQIRTQSAGTRCLHQRGPGRLGLRDDQWWTA